jgi:hypothetical protein
LQENCTYFYTEKRTQFAKTGIIALAPGGSSHPLFVPVDAELDSRGEELDDHLPGAHRLLVAVLQEPAPVAEQKDQVDERKKKVRQMFDKTLDKMFDKTLNKCSTKRSTKCSTNVRQNARQMFDKCTTLFDKMFDVIFDKCSTLSTGF